MRKVLIFLAFALAVSSGASAQCSGIRCEYVNCGPIWGFIGTAAWWGDSRIDQGPCVPSCFEWPCTMASCNKENRFGSYYYADPKGGGLLLIEKVELSEVSRLKRIVQFYSVGNDLPALRTKVLAELGLTGAGRVHIISPAEFRRRQEKDAASASSDLRAGSKKNGLLGSTQENVDSVSFFGTARLESSQ